MVKEFVNEKGSYSLNGFSFGFSWLQCGGGGKSNNSNGGNTGSDTGSKYVCTGGGEIKHGYQLPPCPDPKINDSTLLGIDTNNNGVRDDVEIWIYNTYDTYIPCVEQEVNVTVDNGDIVRAFKDVCETSSKPYHQIVREIAMQWANVYQIVIQEPKKARETIKYEDNALLCEFYFQKDAKYLNEPILINDGNLYKELREIQFNTIKRARAYSEYNFYLSGGVYELENDSKKRRDACDFDVDTLLGKEQ